MSEWGREEGREEGRKEGRKKGMSEWGREGRKEGRKGGREGGREEGERERNKSNASAFRKLEAEFLGCLSWGEFGSYHPISTSRTHRQSRKGFILSSQCDCLIALCTFKHFNSGEG